MESQIKELSYARIITNPKNDTFYWNYALTETDLTREEISEIEGLMKALGRNPAIYFEDGKGVSELKKRLTDSGYIKAFEDSWMFYEGEEPEKQDSSKIKKVESEKDLKLWLKTIDDCYQLNDAQNPYGLLGVYVSLAEETWKKYHESGVVEYFMAYKGEKPVAVVTLTNLNGFGYISNLGSLKEVRGEGFAKKIMLYCIEQSKAHKNAEHFLATEEGTYPNKFYERIGFRTRFRSVCFSKN
jgi:ribosomal protein S18 acetylase RimI-like enzyme